MLKFNLNFNLKKEHYLYIIIIILAVIVVGILSFFLLREDSQPLVTYQPSFRTIEERLKPGTFGETENPVTELPPAMFSTTGIIKEVTETGLVVQGSGSNFNDRQERTLIIAFIDSTVTKKLGDKTGYQGLEGLKYLKEGTEILIEGDENIRGKVQFQARYITIL